MSDVDTQKQEITYEVELTQDANKAALEWPGGKEAVEDWARSEVDELFKAGMKKLSYLGFHMLSSNGKLAEFVCTPRGDDVLVVDTSKWLLLPPLSA